MSKRITYSLAALAATSTLLTNTVFAQDFGIKYDGGKNLEDSITIDSALVDGLTPLLQSEKNQGMQTVVASDDSSWETGYIRINSSPSSCKKVLYHILYPSDDAESVDGLGYSVLGADGNYKAEVDITDIGFDYGNTDNPRPDDKGVTVAIGMNDGWIYGGWAISETKEDCEILKGREGIWGISWPKGEKLFVETNIKLFKKDSKGEFKLYESEYPLYFGLLDIDHGQSFMIKNPNNYISASNTFARSKEALRPSESDDDGLRNRYVNLNTATNRPSYIYSQYRQNPDEDAGEKQVIDIKNGSNVYTKLNGTVQEAGLDMIFGFGRVAGSVLDYYVETVVVKYVSDDGGEITGIKEENVIKGEKPSGSISEAKEGYEFKYWTANIDVKLADGATIKAGDKLTAKQILDVIIDEPVTFTAVHIGSVLTPDTGLFTSESGYSNLYTLGATVAVLLMFGVLAKYAHGRVSKSVKFRK